MKKTCLPNRSLILKQAATRFKRSTPPSDNASSKWAEMANINTTISSWWQYSGYQHLYSYLSLFTSFKSLIINYHNNRNASNMTKFASRKYVIYITHKIYMNILIMIEVFRISLNYFVICNGLGYFINLHRRRLPSWGSCSMAIWLIIKEGKLRWKYRGGFTRLAWWCFAPLRLNSLWYLGTSSHV